MIRNTESPRCATDSDVQGVDYIEEYEQKMRLKVLASSDQRRRRKAERAKLAAAPKSPVPTLSSEGDSLLFDGHNYSLYYAHGGLRVEPAFKEYLLKKGFTPEVRSELFRRINRLVAESPLAGTNILGWTNSQQGREQIRNSGVKPKARN